MRKIWMVAVAMVLSAALAGCAAGGGTTSDKVE